MGKNQKMRLLLETSANLLLSLTDLHPSKQILSELNKNDNSNPLKLDEQTSRFFYQNCFPISLRIKRFLFCIKKF